MEHALHGLCISFASCFSIGQLLMLIAFLVLALVPVKSSHFKFAETEN